MKGRRVRFTATAQRHVDQERTWWLENRDYRDLFATELEAATQLLAVLPGGMSRRLLKFSGGSVDDYATFSAPGLTSPSC